MHGEKILVVDDENDIVELIQYHLEREGYKIIPAYNGEDALELVKKETPDLIILDLMLPRVNGLEICLLLKRCPSTAEIPIIMLTAKGKETDIVVGLELGADDYIIKPFKVRELIARVKAVLRRVMIPIEKKNIVKLNGLVVDLSRYDVALRGEPLELTATEFNLLKCLVCNPGQFFTRHQLLDEVWGEKAFVTDRTVDVHIRRLRKKLKWAASYITTIRGIGYKFKEE